MGIKRIISCQNENETTRRGKLNIHLLEYFTEGETKGTIKPECMEMTSLLLTFRNQIEMNETDSI